MVLYYGTKEAGEGLPMVGGLGKRWPVPEEESHMKTGSGACDSMGVL